MPHTPVGTVDGRNIQTPSIRYNPLAPKVQCYCNLKCVSPNGRKKIKPLTSLLLTRALKHWDLGVRGFNVVRAAGFEYFVHLLSRSLMFSHLLVSKLCCGNINVHAADLLPNCAKHWFFTSKCLLSVSRPIFFYSLIRNIFLSAQNIVFSQVSATFVLPVPFFLFPKSQLIPNCKKHCVFTGKCCMCLSSHFFLFPNSQLIPTRAKHVSLVPFFPIP